MHHLDAPQTLRSRPTPTPEGPPRERLRRRTATAPTATTTLPPAPPSTAPPHLPALLALLLLVLPWTATLAQPFAYATRTTDDLVSVVDLATGTVTDSYPTASVPSGAAVTPDGAWLLVAQSGANSVLAVELATGTTTDVPVGNAPAGVAADPVRSRAYVANTHDDTVSVIALPSLAVVGTVAVGDAPLDLAADGTRLWVANFGDDTVTVVDTDTLAVTATFSVGRMPSGIAAGGGRAWVANLFDDTVSVLDAGSGPGATATIPVAPSPRGVALSPAGDRVWIAGFGDGTVTVLDATTNAVLGSADVALNAADVLITPAGDRVLVTDPASGDLVVLDATNLQPLAPVPAGIGHLAVAGFATPAAFVPEVPALSPGALLVLALLLSASALLLLRLRRHRTVGGALALVLLAGSVGATAPAAAQPALQITDGTMADADWEVFSAVTSGGSQSSIQVTANGNPGAYRYMNHNHAVSEIPQPIQVVHRFVGTGSTYDPATLGAIASIDASWDRRNGFEGLGQVEEAFAVVQGGTAYLTSFESFGSTAWTNTSRTGLTAADFDDGSGGAPDFSATGSPLTFGYVRRTVATFGFGDHGLDNFSVAVAAQSTPPPPPPGNPGILRFEQRAFTAASGEMTDLRVRRVGGSSGAVQVTVQLPPLPLSGLAGQTVVLTWPDGDATTRTATLDLTALPADGPIVILKPVLTSPTGGATLDPSGDFAIVTVVPSDISPLLLLILNLGLFFSATGPLWLLLPTAAGLYAVGRRFGWRFGWPRRLSTASTPAPANSPAEAP